MKTGLKFLGLCALVVALSAFASGCKVGCKKAFKYKTALDAIESRVADSATHPAQIGETCAFLEQEGYETLSDASNFAERAAYNKFYYAETKCVQGYWTVRCDYHGGNWGQYPGYPGHPGYPYPPHQPYPPYYPPYTHCYDYYQCTKHETIEHKLDGFEDAVFVSQQLKNASAELSFACVKFKEGNTLVAMAQFLATKSRMAGPIKEKASLALGKAGCFAKTAAE